MMQAVGGVGGWAYGGLGTGGCCAALRTGELPWRSAAATQSAATHLTPRRIHVVHSRPKHDPQQPTTRHLYLPYPPTHPQRAPPWGSRGSVGSRPAPSPPRSAAAR